MKIGIIGTGNVGGTLGKALAAKGHRITYGVRRPDSPETQEAVRAAGSGSSAGLVREAAEFADVVVLATPWGDATRQAIESCGNLNGKIVIDCTNPVKPDLSGLAIGHDTSAAEQVAAWAKGAKVCKAFNTAGFGVMANPNFRDRKAVMFVCGDDAAAKKVVLQLAADIGFEPIDAGDLSSARLLEPVAMLWIHLALHQGLDPDFAFGLLRR